MWSARRSPRIGALRIAFALLLLAGCLAGCGGGADDGAAAARERIEPYLDRFVEFDRWSRRFEIAGAAIRSREALEETAFAPIRRDPRIAAAVIEREGPDPMELRYPGGAPDLPSEGFVVVRHERLNSVFVLERAIEVSEEVRRDGENGPVNCVILRRRGPAPEGGSLIVTVAFRAGP